MTMVRAVCKNDRKAYASFMAYTVLVFNRKIVTPALFAVLTVVTGILSIFFPASFTLFLIFLAGTLLLFAAIAMKLRSAVNRVMKQSPDFPYIENTYTFHENRFEIVTRIKNKREHKEVLYDDLIAVKERKNAFYLYVTAQLAFLVEKKNITEGSAEELRSIFSAYGIGGKKRKKSV